MTRKDYVSTAKILKNYALLLGQADYEDLVDEFAEMFEADNPNFDTNKFFDACLRNYH
jgi:hypothetical protein